MVALGEYQYRYHPRIEKIDYHRQHQRADTAAGDIPQQRRQKVYHLKCHNLHHWIAIRHLNCRGKKQKGPNNKIIA